MLDTFRKTFHLVAKDRPGRWLALIAGAVLSSVLEMIGAVLVYVLLGLIATPDGGLGLPLIGDVRGLAGGLSEEAFVLVIAVGLGVFFLLRAAFLVTYAYVKHRLAHNAGERISTRLARGYLRMPYAFHLHRNSAQLVRNAHQTMELLVQQCFLATIQVVAEFLIVLGLVAVMLVVAPAATALAVLVIGAAALLLLAVVQPRLRSLGARAQKARERTLALLQQALHGIREMRVFGADALFGKRYQHDRRQLSRALYLRGTAVELPRLVIETSLVLFILVLFATSVAAGAAAEGLLSTLGLFGYAGLRIQPALQRLISSMNNVKFSAPAVDEILEDLMRVEPFDVSAGDATPLAFTEAIVLEDVSFTYESAERPSLQDVNLTIRPGEVIGVCGGTGVGKTTFTDLLIDLLDPTAGQITVDGTRVSDNRAGWHKQIGLVPQMVFLADDTIRRNVALGVADEDVDERALERAISMAQLEEFIRSLPDGLDTVVGERGVRISGGQRQRIAIARALYRQPAVLVFDEGTSALDSVTEAVLVSSLESLRGRHTILLVAHRLSTVRHCDRIVYIEDGRIGGVGRFDVLQSESAGFRALSSLT